MDISYTSMSKICPMTVDQPCKPKKYRAFSGYCNNVQNPRWGNANTKYTRLLMPAYEDGVSLPRGGGIGTRTTLPGARDVSQTVHEDKEREKLQHEYLASMAVVWSQFLGHDLAHTPFVAGTIRIPTSQKGQSKKASQKKNSRSQWSQNQMLWCNIRRIPPRMFSDKDLRPFSSQFPTKKKGSLSGIPTFSYGFKNWVFFRTKGTNKSSNCFPRCFPDLW